MQTLRIAKGLFSGAFAIAVLLLSVLAAVAQDSATIYGLAIPAEVGGLTHGQPVDFETKSPGLGYSLRFAARPGWTVDVYIYDLQLRSIPGDLGSGAVKDQFARARNDIFELGRRGSYANVEEKGDFVVARDGKTRFICSTFSYLRGENRDVDVDSYLCLTSWNDKFVKIRMTAVKGVMSRADAVSFVAAWIPLLWRS
jgi:hypothetical protein